MNSIPHIGLTHPGLIKTNLEHNNQSAINNAGVRNLAGQKSLPETPQTVSTSTFTYSSTTFNASFLSSGVGSVDKYQAIAGQKAPGQYAATILNFIENRLLEDMKAGAREEQLQSRLEAGVEGFLKGYEEARAQLKAAGALTEEVESAITKTYKNVIGGVDKLAQKLGLESPVSDLIEKDAAPEKPTKQTQTAEHANLFADYYSENSFSFRLKTQDGDSVIIRAQSWQTGSFGLSTGRFSTQEGGGNQYQALNASLSKGNDFAFSVEGELDADELRAINELLGQISDVSETFFNGDVYSAFEQALEVGFDSDEIARFSLTLKRTDLAKVDSSYNRIADYGNNQLPQRTVNQPLAEIADFIQQLDEARRNAEKIGLELLTLTGMADFVGKNKFAQHHTLPHFTPLVGKTLQSLQNIQAKQQAV